MQPKSILQSVYPRSRDPSQPVPNLTEVYAIISSLLNRTEEFARISGVHTPSLCCVYDCIHDWAAPGTSGGAISNSYVNVCWHIWHAFPLGRGRDRLLSKSSFPDDITFDRPSGAVKTPALKSDSDTIDAKEQRVWRISGG